MVVVHCRTLVSSLMAMALLAMATADNAPSVCGVGVSELAECLPAVTGFQPLWPTKSCCKFMHKADLACLCKHKDKFLEFGISPPNAMALPNKCDQLPVECKG